MRGNPYFAILLGLSTMAAISGCQTAGGKNTSLVGPATKPAGEVAAPQFKKGDEFEFENVSRNPSHKFRRIYKEDRDGNLVFDMGDGREAIYTRNLAAVRFGDSSWKPHSGMLQFPMKVGSKWSHEYRDVHNNKERIRSCSVDDWSTVKTPAGEFPAYIISCRNQWTEATNPAYENYWYAPTAKQVVWYKSDEFKTEYHLSRMQLK